MATVTCLTSGVANVLARVQESPLKPTELVDVLRSQYQYSYGEIQDAIAELIERGCIELTPDRFLKVIRHP